MTAPQSSRDSQPTDVTPAAAPPDDLDELRQDIERTRAQLGETVEQLAARADVAGRAKAKAADVASQVRSTAAASRDKAAEVVQTTVPEPVRSTVAKGAGAAQQRRVPLAAG